MGIGRFKSKKNDEWLDWLTDEPAPASIRMRMRTKAVEAASRPVVRRVGQSQPPQEKQPAIMQQTDNTSTVSLHISVPKLKKPKLPNLPHNLTYKRLGVGASSLLLIVVISGITVHVRHKKAKPSGSTGVLSASNEKPGFSTLTPDKSTENIDKKYDPKKKVVSYVDSIGGVQITISQQQLPVGFQDNPEDKVKKLAQDFSASEVLSTANPTAYLGTSAKGPQTVIFTKGGLLIFIQSASKIDNHDWAEYITNLK